MGEPLYKWVSSYYSFVNTFINVMFDIQTFKFMVQTLHPLMKEYGSNGSDIVLFMKRRGS